MGAVKVKKVSAYPIRAQLVGAEGPIPGQIVKLTQVGMLIETEKPIGLGHQFTVTFQLPVMDKVINGVAVVVKTYARYGGEPGKSKSHSLNELHFRSASTQQNTDIQAFLAAIKQK